MPASDVGLIASALGEFAKVIGNWQNSAERRRMQAAIEAAEKYIQANEREGVFKALPDKKRIQYLIHFRKRFFAYNN